MPKPIIKSHIEVDVALCYRSSRFPLNICATAEASNFKFGTRLGLANAHHKNHNQRKKLAWPWVREAPKYLGFPCDITATAALSS